MQVASVSSWCGEYILCIVSIIISLLSLSFFSNKISYAPKHDSKILEVKEITRIAEEESLKRLMEKSSEDKSFQ